MSGSEAPAMGPVDWLKYLHRYTEQDIELRSFTNIRDEGPLRRIWTRDEDDVESFVRKWDIDRRGTFFGVATRTNRGGKVDHCQEVPALWIDCDDHRPLDELRDCHMPPSAIVESGGGVHAYWVLDEPYDVSAVTMASKDGHPVIAALAGLKRIFNGDAAVVDIARVMRLPGTTNSKRETPVACTVLEHNDREYGFDDIVEWLGWQRELVGEPVDPFLAAMDELGIKPPLDVEEMLDGMVYGENVHEVQLKVTASLQGSGAPEDEIVERVITATRLAVGREGTKWDWKRETANVRDMIRTARSKFGAPQNSGAATAVKVVDIGEEREKRSAIDDIVSGKAKKDDEEPVFVKAGRITLKAWERPLISLEGELWRYEKGIWKRFDPSDEAEIEMALQKALTLIKASPSITNKRNGYKWLINHPDLFRKGVTWDSKPIVVGRNAILELDTFAVLPHAEEDFATRRVDCDIDPDADCPVWKTFLATIFDEDVALTVQEWFGAALIRNKRRELTRALIVKGASNTGKTQLSKVLRALLSSKTAGAQVRHLEESFGLQTFVDATGWVADDAIGQNEKLDPESFKILVTGESVSVMRKHLPPIEMSFDFPVLLTSNHLPKVRDDSNAVYSRSLLVQLDRELDEADAPPEETSITVIRGELAGVLNWSIEGWKRLKERGRFDPPKTMRAKLEEFQDDNTPIIGWIRQCVEASPGTGVDRRDLLASAAGYYAENYGDGSKMAAPVKVYKLICDIRKTPKDPKKFKDRRYQLGVKLNDDGMSYWDLMTGKSFSNYTGSGVTRDGVNHRMKEPKF